MQWVSLAILMLFPVSSTPITPKPQGQKTVLKKGATSTQKQAPTSQKTRVAAPQARQVAPKAQVRAAAPKARAVAPKVKKSKPVKRRVVASATKDKASKTPKDKVNEPTYVRDTTVSVQTLKNGLTSWCKADRRWNMTQVYVSIAAGTATDPKGLYGTARFLARLLEKQINEPKRPPHSLLPPGGNRYTVKLGKDWVQIHSEIPADKVQEALRHIARVLHKGPGANIPKSIQTYLKRSATRFPPPSLLERIDRYLFTKNARGELLRGDKRTFKNIRPFRLQTSYKSLYRGPRIRVLVVGNVECTNIQKNIQKGYQGLPKKAAEVTKKKTKKPAFRPSGRLFLARELLHIYQLPTLERKDHLPLYIVGNIAKRELRRQLNREFGASFPFFARTRLSKQSGYMAYALPSSPSYRKKLEAKLKQALGSLRMHPYHPTLKHRLQMYRERLALELKGMQESSRQTAQLLLAQLQLSSGAFPYPRAVQPLIQQINAQTVRKWARQYMGQVVSLKNARRPFSQERMILFIGMTLLLGWLLLDRTFRRSKKNEE